MGVGKMVYFWINKTSRAFAEEQYPQGSEWVNEYTVLKLSQYTFKINNPSATLAETLAETMTPPTAEELLATAKASKLSELNSAYDAIQADGFDTGQGFVMGLTDYFRDRYSQQATHLVLKSDRGNNPTDFDIFSQDLSYYTLNLGTAKQVFDAYGDRVQNLFDQKLAYNSQIENAVDAETVNAITINFV